VKKDFAESACVICVNNQALKEVEISRVGKVWRRREGHRIDSGSQSRFPTLGQGRKRRKNTRTRVEGGQKKFFFHLLSSTTLGHSGELQNQGGKKRRGEVLALT